MKKTDNFDCIFCKTPIVIKGKVIQRALRHHEGYECWDCCQDDLKEKEALERDVQQAAPRKVG